MNNRKPPRFAALALALAAAIAAPAFAQSASPKAPSAAEQQQLDAARARLDAAAKQYAELASRYAADQHAMELQHRLLRKPVIGVVLGSDPEGGVRIAAVTPGGAAAEAGLKSGDRIVAVDGKRLAGSDPEARLEAAREAIGKHDEGSKVSLRYLRDGREATVSLAPRPGERVLFFDVNKAGGIDVIRLRAQTEAARTHAELARAAAARHAAIAPEIRREIIRLSPGSECAAGTPCAFPVISEALRWNGLNLASLDADLGKYFGTDKGVLVLGTGPGLGGLRAGDVIRSVDGKPVSTPREVMDALRGRDSGDKVDVGYLRERRAGATVVTVPEPVAIPLPPAPPVPPAPPPSPNAPGAAPPAPPVPPAAPPAPPAPPAGS